MIKALAFGLAAGAGIQAWRNFPSEGPVTADGLAVVFVLGVVLAYLGGRWHGRGIGAYASATATATATAASQATNTVNVAFVVPGEGARHTGVSVPDDTASWFSPTPAPALSLDQLDGMEVTDLLEESAEAERRL